MSDVRRAIIDGFDTVWSEVIRRAGATVGLPVVDIASSIEIVPTDILLWTADKSNKTRVTDVLQNLEVAFGVDCAWIGPIVRLGYAEGCGECRRLWSRHEWSPLDPGPESHLATTPIPHFAIATAALLVQLAIDPPRSSRAWRISRTLDDISSHPVLRHTDCPRCKPITPDNAAYTRKLLSHDEVVSESSFRTRALNLTVARLAPLVLDRHCGMVRKLYDAPSSTHFPTIYALLHLGARPGQREVGVGRTGRSTEDRMVAIVEAIERYAGFRPRRYASTINSSFASLGNRAVDPNSFILHAKHQHREPGYELCPYEPHVPLRWVYAYSCRRDASVLVPEQLAYYRLPAGSRRFVQGSSNGCAAGGSLAEAALYGLFEVVERDAFLAAWYGARRLRRIDLDGIDDPLSVALLQRLGADDYEVEVVDLDSDVLLAAVAVTVCDRRPGRGATILHGAGAHRDPVKALQSALVEVASMVVQPSERQIQEAYRRGREMLIDPSHVRSMRDHSTQCWPPEALGRCEFRRSILPPLTWHNWTARFGEITGTNPREHFENLIESVLAISDDVLIVDQSFEPAMSAGLRCVKVLVPGMLPMTFGHQYRRVSIERLRKVDPNAKTDYIDGHPHIFP